MVARLRLKTAERCRPAQVHAPLRRALRVAGTTLALELRAIVLRGDASAPIVHHQNQNEQS
jgi:hypothetical protein